MQMSLSEEQALQRVKALLLAASRVREKGTLWNRRALDELPAVTGLSRAGVELALTEHLEHDESDFDFRELFSSVPRASTAHVVLSSNIFVGALRAVMLAACSAERVTVRPSRREPVFFDILFDALGRPDWLTEVSDIETQPGDVVHVYGQDSTISAIAQALPEDVSLWGHGSGFGVAVIDASAFEQAVSPLARDVVVFDQRGCLSPRVVFVFGEEIQCETIAERLAEELEQWQTKIPIGAIDDHERALRRAYADTICATGLLFENDGAMVGLDNEPQSFLLPPLPRVVHMMRVSTVEQAKLLLEPMRQFVTRIGGQGQYATELQKWLPDARPCVLGRMQKPRLDGPVDRRVALKPLHGR